MGNLHWQRKSNLKKGLGLLSRISIKGIRSKVFPTCLPVSGSIRGSEKVWPGRTLRKGFIGQYRFWIKQIGLHERQGSAGSEGLVTLSI